MPLMFLFLLLAYNPSDYFLDLLSPDRRSPEVEEETMNRIHFLVQKWLEVQKQQPENSEIVESSTIRLIGTEKDNINNVWRNLLLLSWRSWAELSRNIPNLMGRMSTTIFFALVVGGIYSNTDLGQDSIRDRTGALFFIGINQCFNTFSAVLPVYPQERRTFNRERKGGAYNTLSFFLAKLLVQIPLNVFPVLIFSLIIHR